MVQAVAGPLHTEAIEDEQQQGIEQNKSDGSQHRSAEEVLSLQPKGKPDGESPLYCVHTLKAVEGK